MIFLPSKYRPDGVRRFIASYQRTGATHPVVIATDNDHPGRLAEYQAIPLPPPFSLVVMDAAPVAHDMNTLFLMFPHEAVYGSVSDDCIALTPGWDARLIEAANQHGIAWPNDLIATSDHNPRWGDMFIDGWLMRGVGYYAPPGIEHLYFDQVWIDIADYLGIGQYLPDVVLEHLHWSAGKSEYDESYRAHAAHAEADRLAYEAWRTNPKTWARIERLRERKVMASAERDRSSK